MDDGIPYFMINYVVLPLLSQTAEMGAAPLLFAATDKTVKNGEYYGNCLFHLIFGLLRLHLLRRIFFSRSLVNLPPSLLSPDLLPSYPASFSCSFFFFMLKLYSPSSHLSFFPFSQFLITTIGPCGVAELGGWPTKTPVFLLLLFTAM